MRRQTHHAAGTKKAREIDATNTSVRGYDKVIAANPPVITWRRGNHGVWVATSVNDPHAETPGSNSSKTHCKNKHPFDEVNTLFKTDGSRQCRTCKAEWSKQRRAAA